MTYSIEEEDFCTATAAAAMATTRRRAVAVQSWGGNQSVSGIIIIGAFLFAAAYSASRGDSLLELNWPFWIVMLLLGVNLFVSPIRYRRCLRRLYRTTDLSGKVFDMQWNDAGIRVEAASSFGEFQWGAFKFYLETPLSFVLQLDGASYFIFPKRFFREGELASFDVALGHHLIKKKI